MKRIYFILIFLFAIITGCSVRESGGEPDKGVFMVRYADGLNDTFSQWSPGDEISINGYRYMTEKGGVEACFVPVDEPVPSSATYFAVYPADLPVEDMTASGAFPQVQYVVAGALPARGSDVAVAKTSGRNLIFQRISSYMSVKIMTEGVKSIILRSKGNEPLWGEYTVDYSETQPSVAVTGGDTQVQIEPCEDDSFPEGAQLYFLLPPKTLKSGFVFSALIQTSEGQVSWEQSVSEHTVFYRGKLLDLGSFHYDSSSGLGRLDYTSEIPVTVDCAETLDSPVSNLLFGSFSEMHGGDLVPGILEQYIVNTSFETWEPYGDKGETKNELVFTGSNAVQEDPAVAYPWEKRLISGNAAFSVTSEDKLNTERSQKIVVEQGGTAALLQRLALPDYRILKYRLRFHACILGDISMSVSFHDAYGKENTKLSNSYSPVSIAGEWKEYECEFSLSKSSSMFNNRHGVYNLWFEFSGEGTVYLDHVTLFPADCIDGIFNPETVEYIKKYKVKAMRWPGGNFTSAYNWKNGIGKWVDRPCLKNKAWGGLDSNLLGTDEFMRFCQLTGIEPVMGVGYNPSVITEQDIVDWVEYCNGDVSSEYGSLRAQNGHPESYDVRYWGIGNEVYGGYQLGHASASVYSQGLNSISDRIKTVCPEARIIASGRGVHNYSRGTYPDWNETLVAGAQSSFDLLDSHMYVYGNDQSGDLGLGAEGWFRVFVASNLNLRDFLAYIRELMPGKKAAFLEWGVLPKLSGKAYETPQRQTFANLLVSACVYNEMIRQSDIVEMAALHNFSFYVAPHTLHSEPVNMRTELIRELSELSGGYAVPVNIAAVPVYEQPYDVLDVGERRAVPEIDMAAVLKGDVVYVSCVNRSLSEEYKLDIDLEGVISKAVSGRTYTCEMPFVRSLWDMPVGCVVESAEVIKGNKVSVPPLSYTILKISVDRNS